MTPHALLIRSKTETGHGFATSKTRKRTKPAAAAGHENGTSETVTRYPTTSSTTMAEASVTPQYRPARSAAATPSSPSTAIATGSAARGAAESAHQSGTAPRV